METTVLLVDDHMLVRKGIRKLLEDHPCINVIGEADNGRAAVELARAKKPDVVVMDLAMPGLNGIDATRLINEENLGCRVIVLTMHATQSFVAQSLAAGVNGYVLKDCAAEELVHAIECAAAGSVYLSPKISAVIAQDYKDRFRTQPCEPDMSLTTREREVLQSLAEGKSMKEIAFGLALSVKTVESHKLKIMKKTNCGNVAEMVKYAIREGISNI